MEQKKRLVYFLACMLALALILRVGCVLLHGHEMLLGSLTAFDNDDVKYIRSGTVLLEHHRLVYQHPDAASAFIGPVLPAALAVVFSVFGAGTQGILAFQILQAIIGTLSVLLIFLIGREIFSRRVGMLAGLVYAVEPTAVWNCGYVLTETLFTFLLLLILYVSYRAVQRKSATHFVLLGIFWATASLLKSAIGLYLGVVIIAMLLSRYRVKEIAKYATIAGVAFMVVMSPWWVRNYVQFHRFIPFTASSGNPMMLGTFVHYKTDVSDLRGYDRAETEIEQNDIEVNVAKERISRKFTEEFWTYAYWYTIGKTVFLWRDPFFWTQDKSLPTLIAIYILHYLILISGIAGAVLGLRKDIGKMALPVGTLVYFTLVHLPFFVMSRYSFPLMAIMLILASSLVIQIREKSLNKARPSLSPPSSPMPSSAP